MYKARAKVVSIFASRWRELIPRALPGTTMNSVNSLDAHVGCKICAAREAQSLTAENFAHALSIPVQELFKLESGTKRFNPILLFKALKALSLDMKDLFVDLPLQRECGNVRLSFDAKTVNANGSAI